MPPSYYSSSQRVAHAPMETETRDAPPANTNSSSNISARPIRPPILPRDKFDGVDSDDETDEEEAVDEEDEDEHPEVVGEVEIDMADEQEEFLEFARQALGMSDDQWGEILHERSQRGGT